MNHYRSLGVRANCLIGGHRSGGRGAEERGQGRGQRCGHRRLPSGSSCWYRRGLIILVTLMIHASRLKVPLSKLLGKIVSDSKREGERERRETALRKLRESQAMGGGPMGQQKGSVGDRKPPESVRVWALQRLHALNHGHRARGL